jgi:hypothetical protein
MSEVRADPQGRKTQDVFYSRRLLLKTSSHVPIAAMALLMTLLVHEISGRRPLFWQRLLKLSARYEARGRLTPESCRLQAGFWLRMHAVVRHDGALKIGAGLIRIEQLCRRESRIPKVSPGQVGIGEVGLEKVSPVEYGAGKV